MPLRRPGKKGEKNKNKNISPVFSQKKTFFRESPVFLAALPGCYYSEARHLGLHLVGLAATI
jgi:hypothetical protein